MKKSSLSGYGNGPGDSQNIGNLLGSRPCVRQSRLYREGCSGNAMKDILGQGELKWDTTRTEGCYKGGHVYDHNTKDNLAVQQEMERDQEKTSAVEGEDEEIEVEVVDKEAATPAPQQETDVPQKSDVPPRVSASTGRGFRPCSGMANQQTYNIFTGE
ncbi:unnamed protein product [Phytomonas sp. EM1]|nr:unnamed protein product [Phytomonas sp. EM1]|eukprot:CCW63579.1 unnamed protein product [Phytomonas sp. isolate EM1]